MDFMKYITQTYGEDVASIVEKTCKAFHCIDFECPQYDIAERILTVHNNHKTLLKIANDIDGMTLYDQPEGWDGFDVWFHWTGGDMSKELQAIIMIGNSIKNVMEGAFNTKKILKSVV